MCPSPMKGRAPRASSVGPVMQQVVDDARSQGAARRVNTAPLEVCSQSGPHRTRGTNGSLPDAKPSSSSAGGRAEPPQAERLRDIVGPRLGKTYGRCGRPAEG